MPFLIEAQRRLTNLPPGTANHAILEYLITNATGATNAKPWTSIERHCAELQISVNKLNFQQGFLAETRDGDIFIGSCSKGYFIIGGRNDAVVAARFYQVRIARQQQHLDHLQDLVTRQNWS